MPQNHTCIYSNEFPGNTGQNENLFIEIADCHLAYVVTQVGHRSVSAFELFTFNKGEQKNFVQMLDDVAGKSKISERKFSDIHIYFNDERCVAVPVMKYDENLIESYFDVAIGNDHTSKIKSEHLTVMPGIVNVFGIDIDMLTLLGQKYYGATFHHTYSNIIKRGINSISDFDGDLISVQFYNYFFTVIAFKEGEMQLIRSFTYDVPDDVLYHLLSIKGQLGLSERLTLQVSGLIDLDFNLYRAIIVHFSNVITDNHASSILPGVNNEHPLHYFSPFLNLAI